MPPPRYATIVADPPWEHPDAGRRTKSTAGGWGPKWLGHESKVPYERMTLEEIKALPVGELAARDAHLYLWTTNGFLERGYAVVRAWGFRSSTLLTWCKAPMGIGFGGAYTITTEFVIYARRCSLRPLRAVGLDVVRLQAPVQRERCSGAQREAGRFLDVIE